MPTKWYGWTYQDSEDNAEPEYRRDGDDGRERDSLGHGLARARGRAGGCLGNNNHLSCRKTIDWRGVGDNCQIAYDEQIEHLASSAGSETSLKMLSRSICDVIAPA
jgi:hypothetical protein